MVLIDGKKFACQACIKGHRSSSCVHTDRELIEIGKKGRPPTQCNHCRELRRTKQIHSKCMCGDKPQKKVRRTTVLSNGKNKALAPIPPLETLKTYDIIKEISNPCSCRFGGKCCCSNHCNDPKQEILSTLEIMQPKNFEAESSSEGLLELGSILTPASPSASTSNFVTTPSCHGSSNPTRLKQTDIPGAFHRSSSDAPPPLDKVLENYPHQPSDYNPLLHSPPNSFSELRTSTSDTQALAVASASGTRSQIPDINPEEALFAPQTAGTALCFCGIHCPCPGCLLHDPLGLKFQRHQTFSPCPTSNGSGEGCIGGLDLPTANSILNLSPIAENFPSQVSVGNSKSGESNNQNNNNVTNSGIQLPSVIQTLGLLPGEIWEMNETNQGSSWGTTNEVNQATGISHTNRNKNKGCCSGGSSSSGFKEITSKALGNRVGGCCGGGGGGRGIGSTSNDRCGSKNGIKNSGNDLCCQPGQCQC